MAEGGIFLLWIAAAQRLILYLTVSVNPFLRPGKQGLGHREKINGPAVFYAQKGIHNGLFIRKGGAAQFSLMFDICSRLLKDNCLHNKSGGLIQSP